MTINVKNVKLSKNQITHFQNFIWDFYRQEGRTFAWRNIDNPYQIVVSEIMLQQTQTYRVEPKFEQFISEFADFQSLAQAPLRDVLCVWQGLGYNRRAMALRTIAQKVMQEYGGILPQSPAILETFTGIGKATAASICAFAFNMSTTFIETNIRTVFIHSFFRNEIDVVDKQLLPIVEDTLDTNNPREWYYALMDYGVKLKSLHPNPSRKSAHHAKQSRFQGSDRQIRGMILRMITAEQEGIDEQKLVALLQKEETRVQKIIQQLCDEGFLIKMNNRFVIV
jgi:A/G-specific adenine glycosylase